MIHGNNLTSETPNELQSSSPVLDDKNREYPKYPENQEDRWRLNKKNSDVVKINKIKKNDDNPINFD